MKKRAFSHHRFQVGEVVWHKGWKQRGKVAGYNETTGTTAIKWRGPGGDVPLGYSDEGLKVYVERYRDQDISGEKLPRPKSSEAPKKKARKRKVFVIQGSCGAYDDYSEWLINTAYTTKLQAERHRDLASKRSSELSYPEDSGKNEYDANWRTDFGGTLYQVLELTLSNRAPKPTRTWKGK